MDGQNLFVTLDSNLNLRAARNMSDIKKGGMTAEEYLAKWKDHPAEDAFSHGFKAIGTALNSLSADKRLSLFRNGSRYVNMEIMYPDNPNIIRYGGAYVVLHGFKTFDEDGKVILVHPSLKSNNGLPIA